MSKGLICTVVVYDAHDYCVEYINEADCMVDWLNENYPYCEAKKITKNKIYNSSIEE